jgi:hypothetical protein
MKKQILFLTMFTLALIFAGTNKVVGQLLPGATIDPLGCLASSEPLHPFPGVPYKYTLDGTQGEMKALSYTWWATKDPTFISGPVNIADMTGSNMAGRLTVSPGQLIATSTNYATTTPAATAGSNEIEITWSPDILSLTEYQATPADAPKTSTFVVGYAEGDNCADNIQVFEIAPVPNFTIDIAAIDPADNTTTLPWDDITTAKLCVDDVQSAVYNTGTFELDMDYGENTFYFEVAAANFVKNWTPTFTLDQATVGSEGLRGSQTAVLEMFPTLGDAIAGTGSLGSNTATPWTSAGGTWATGVALTAATPADAATGVSVFVKVVISNNQEESLTSNGFNLAVDARDNDATGIWDMEDDDCDGSGTGTDDPDQVDQATITVTPRPQLDNATTPNTIPDPDTYILKTP